MDPWSIAAVIMAVVSILTAAYSIYVAKGVKPPGVNTEDFDENSIPTPKEGVGIPVVFGTKRIKDSNVVFYGNIGSDDVTKKV